MNISPTPKTPVRTPQPGSSAKALQLTPIWQEVVKNGRLPPDINQDLIFKEISTRLEDLEWPVRQHAFRVLSDIIPILSKDCLDERVIQNEILSKLVINLGHPAPGIRKVASETVQKYLRRTGQSERMLETFVQYGVKEMNLINNDKAGILRENITLGTIVSMADVLRPFIVPENGGYCLTQAFLIKILQALANQLRNPNYREECLESLRKIRGLVGKQRFQNALQDVADRDLIVQLMLFGNEEPAADYREIEEIAWSDETKSDNSYDDINYLKPLRKVAEKYKESAYIVSNESSEDYTDGTDTETYTKDPAPNDFAEEDFYPAAKSDAVGGESHLPPSFLPIQDLTQSCQVEEKRSDPSSPRVLLEAEIQVAKNKAITMRVTEEEEAGQEAEDEEEEEEDVDDDEEEEDDDDSSSNANSESSLVERRFTTEDGHLIMKVLHNNDEIIAADKPRTPRRVRFGGEVIKLRTPDSDTTDVTIEIHEAEADKKPKEEVAILVEEIDKDVVVEIPVAEEKGKVVPSSQIPVPVAPATTSPRDVGFLRRKELPRKTEEDADDGENSPTTSKTDSFDSAPSSSGSETDVKDLWTEDTELNFWQWSELRLVEENILKDLRNKDDWKIQYQALEQLKLVLISPKAVERIAKPKNQNLLGSLIRCLLYKLPETSNQQVTTLSLSIVSQIIEILPREVILLHVEDIVHGLCRYVGGSRNLNLKIEAVQSLKVLFGILEPSSVIDVLLGERCLFSPSSKLRENALLAIMYATMMFPSNYFNVDRILEKVADSTIDSRRRVRHAALEAIAILSQFPSPRTLTENIARVADKLATPLSRGQLIAAIQARLSRRLLPSVSSEGLVLYALQIPASRRFGHMGNPMGADVDWILSATGSLSTGSVKSKTQLNAAQRLDAKPSTSVSLGQWGTTGERKSTSNGNNPPATALNEKTGGLGNPWTVHKNRNESSEVKAAAETGGQRTKVKGKDAEGTSSNDSEHPKTEENGGFQKNNSNRPEDIMWALVPLTTLDESQLAREKGSGIWAESIIDNIPHGFGPIRPLYLKLQPGHDQLILSRSSDDVRRLSGVDPKKFNSNRFEQEGCTEIRLLTPTVLRDKGSDSYYQNGKHNQTRIPVLFNNQRNLPKGQRFSAYATDRKTSEGEDDNSNSIKLAGLNSTTENGFSAFLPSIHSSQPENNYNSRPNKAAVQNKFGEVDEIKLQDTMSQLSGLLTNSRGVGRCAPRDLFLVQNQLVDDGPTEKFIEPDGFAEGKNQSKTPDRGHGKSHENLPGGVASAPAMITTELRGQTPSTSSSNSTDFGTLSGNELRIRRLTNQVTGTLDQYNDQLPYRTYTAGSSKHKSKNLISKSSANKVGISGNPFPESLKAFERPKEGLDTCFNQLESQQWEVNMLGLTSLVRLLRHHPAIVLSQLHSIIVALSRQVRNLRSQVARAACQASAEMFLILKRNVEPDLDELSGPLFHRSADTNRFIRADCNDALDNMVDSVGHAKAVSIIISKGTTHQNATVRAVATRLLLRLSERVGPEKMLSLPKEIRDKMLQTGASLLTEGKLETRAFAKQVFRVWSSHPSFSNLILEAVPPNIMRQINKTLVSLKT